MKLGIIIKALSMAMAYSNFLLVSNFTDNEITGLYASFTSYVSVLIPLLKFGSNIEIYKLTELEVDRLVGRVTWFNFLSLLPLLILLCNANFYIICASFLGAQSVALLSIIAIRQRIKKSSPFSIIWDGFVRNLFLLLTLCLCFYVVKNYDLQLFFASQIIFALVILIALAFANRHYLSEFEFFSILKNWKIVICQFLMQLMIGLEIIYFSITNVELSGLIKAATIQIVVLYSVRQVANFNNLRTIATEKGVPPLTLLKNESLRSRSLIVFALVISLVINVSIAYLLQEKYDILQILIIGVFANLATYLIVSLGPILSVYYFNNLHIEAFKKLLAIIAIKIVILVILPDLFGILLSLLVGAIVFKLLFHKGPIIDNNL